MAARDPGAHPPAPGRQLLAAAFPAAPHPEERHARAARLPQQLRDLSRSQWPRIVARDHLPHPAGRPDRREGHGSAPGRLSLHPRQERRGHDRQAGHARLRLSSDGRPRSARWSRTCGRSRPRPERASDPIPGGATDDHGPAGNHQGRRRHAHHEPARPAERAVAPDAGRHAGGAAPARGRCRRGRRGADRRRARLLRRRRRQGHGEGTRVRRHHHGGEGAGAALAHGDVSPAARDAQADHRHGARRGGRRRAVAGAGLRPARRQRQCARFATAFARVGYSGDFGGSYFLTQLVGTAKARELYYTADCSTPRQALALGMVNRVVPDAQLEEETMALAAQDRARPPRGRCAT